MTSPIDEGEELRSRNEWTRRAWLIGLFMPTLVVGLVPVADGQLTPEAVAAPVFKADSGLALVPFRVSYHRALVNLLTADHVRLLEDGVTTKIALLEGGPSAKRTIPVDVLLLFDCRRSVIDAGLLNPDVVEPHLLDGLDQVRIAVYGFSDRTVRLSRPSNNVEEIGRALKFVSHIPTGGTPLYRALFETIQDAKQPGEQAIRKVVIFSDGLAGEKGAAFFNEAVQLATQNGIAVYPVALVTQDTSQVRMNVDPAQPPSGQRPRMRLNAHDIYIANQISTFLSLAEATGGRGFRRFRSSGGVLGDVLRTIASDVNSEYVVGFYPAEHAEKRPHRVQVILLNTTARLVSGGTRTLVY